MSSNFDSHDLPKTIAVTDYVMESVIKSRLDQTDYLGLGSCQRSELFLYALALGRDSGLSLPLKNSHGLFRTETLSYSDMAVFRAVHYATNEFERPDELCNVNETIRIAQEYANGGFQLLEGELNDNLESFQKANEIVAALSDKYQEMVN